VRIINVARGGLIDRDSAAAALQAIHVGGLGFDVTWEEPVPPDDPLLKDPRVMVTPHIAGVTQLSYRAMADIVVRECMRLRQGLAPSVWLNEAAMQAAG
jgi:phosphoglycerate dehydrogenase-like enzyme